MQRMQFCGPSRLTVTLRFLSDESGQDLIEYALLSAIIGLAAIASIRVLANDLKAVFTAIPARAEAAIYS